MGSKQVLSESTLPQQTSESTAIHSRSDDPVTPVKFGSWRKWSIVGFMSAMTFIVNFALLVCSPAIPSIKTDFHITSSFNSVFVITIWDLGEALVPLAIAPLSERYGRLPVYHSCNLFFVVTCLVTGFSRDISMILAFRLLTGASTASITLNPCIVGDMFPQHERGAAMSVMGMVPLLGTVVGPVAGGYATQSLGWRWTFWLSAALAGAVGLGFIFVLRETYAPTLLDKRAQAQHPSDLTRQSGGWVRPSAFLWRLTALITALLRPVRLMCKSATATALSVFMAVVYSYLYLAVSTVSSIFQMEYGFSVGSSGLALLGITIGMLIGALFCRFTLDRVIGTRSSPGLPSADADRPSPTERTNKEATQCIRRQQQHIPESSAATVSTRSAEDAKPTERLIPMLPGAVLLPAGLFLYGWSLEARTAWIVPILGTGLMGFGLSVTTIPTWSYIVDAFGTHSASAMAAALVLRNLVGAFLPVAGPYLFARLGYGWGNSVLGSIALSFMPVPLILVLRERRAAQR